MTQTPKPKKHLSFTALRQSLSRHVRSLADPRHPGKRQYSQHDALMSAFACMFFQAPSLAQFQKRMEEGRHKNNLRSLFDVQAIPSDNQLRDILDTIPSESLAPVFADYYERMRRHKHLEAYAILPGMLMCVIDGTDYHSSSSVHCPCCLQSQHRNGTVTYRHAVLQGAIMHPDQKQVIPLMPEAIHNSDGQDKQDCESNAAKRFVRRLHQAHPRQTFLVVGDGLMSHQPLIETTLNEGMHYLFVLKPGDHAYLMDWLAAYTDWPSHTWQDDKSRTHHYRWQQNVPLNGRADSVQVNYLEYPLINAQGKLTYRNSWVTDLPIKLGNVVDLARAGRCRWKIENECFNTLKNQGYHIEHNYGHGQQHLSYNMYLLTLLAFFMHQIFELTDKQYQACRQKSNSKAYLWECLRGTIRIVVLPSWEVLLDMFLFPDNYGLVPEKG